MRGKLQSHVERYHQIVARDRPARFEVGEKAIAFNARLNSGILQNASACKRSLRIGSNLDDTTAEKETKRWL